jgi:cytidyltransferase-like protein
MKIVIVTGGFDPIHSGHIAYFNAAKQLGDKLIVGLNSDNWLAKKKGRSFMPWTERSLVIQNLKQVDEVLEFDDQDGSAKDCIRQVRALFPNDTIIFANGGDRTKKNIPEMDINDDNVFFEFAVGGDNKANSSSWILQEWKAPKTERPWGYYRVLHEVPGMKVKELTVDPGKSLSMQRHNLRSEYWIVSEGKCMVEHHGHAVQTDEYLVHTQLATHQEFRIPQLKWHRLFNPYDVPCRIVEIQYGDKCEEEDIERNEKNTVFVGWDSREDIAYQVCRHSIKKYNTEINVVPIKQDELRNNNLYWREPDKYSTTEFTFTRFLVPYLSNYQGWAVFVDCDFVFLDDVKKLFDQADDKYAVMCVHHNYVPTEEKKMDGMKQRPYPRKNWSSMILWNCAHPANRGITPDLVNSATGQHLHRFMWLPDELIGEINLEWNWLVNWYKEPKDGTPKAIHYTEGGPWFNNYRTCEYSNVWMDEYNEIVKEQETDMEAYIIHLPKIEHSLKTATNLKASLESYGITAHLSNGVYGTDAIRIMEEEQRTVHPWGIKGPNNLFDPMEKSVLKAQTPGVKGCFLSHYNLWKKCVELDKPIMIFEDDVVLSRGYQPVTFNDILILAIGHPTKSADYWDYLNAPDGRPFAETWPKSSMPGAMGYAIKPHAAKKLLEVYKNTYLPADNAINGYHIKMEITTHLMGRALVDEDGKKSLTRTTFWEDFKK